MLACRVSRAPIVPGEVTESSKLFRNACWLADGDMLSTIKMIQGFGGPASFCMFLPTRADDPTCVKRAGCEQEATSNRSTLSPRGEQGAVSDHSCHVSTLATCVEWIPFVRNLSGCTMTTYESIHSRAILVCLVVTRNGRFATSGSIGPSKLWLSCACSKASRGK